MATSTVLTNKPINPRGDDNRPVDSYNRASLYSGKALDFDGVNDFVEVPYNADTRPTSEITLSAIVKLDDWNLSVLERVISCTEAGGWHIANGEGSYIPAQNTGMLIRLSSSGYVAVYVSNDILKDEYNHLTTTFDGRYLKMYVNGVLAATTDSGTTQTITYAVNNSIYIGAEAGGGSGTPIGNYIDGQISNAKVFDVALTAAQVADLYNNPEKVVPTGVDNTALKLWLPMMEGAGTTAYDGSGNGNHGTISGATYVNGIGAPVAQSAVMDWNKGTNRMIYSEQFDNAAWLKDATILTANDTTAPDGSQTADKIEFTAAGAAIYDQFINVANSLHIGSVFLKNENINSVQLEIIGGGPVILGQTTIDLTDGSLSASVGDYTPVATDEGNGWYRVSVGDTGETTIATPSLKIKRVGSNGSFYAWGAQVEAADSLGAYIPNHTGTPITTEVLLPQGLTTGRDITGVNLFENVRKQGALNLDGNSWAEVHDNASLDFGTGSFTLEAWIKGKFVSQGSVFNMVISLGGNITSSNNAGLMVLNNTVPYFIYSNPGALTGSAQTEGDWIHMVGTYDQTNTRFYVNGVQTGQSARTAADITNEFVKVIGRDGTDPNRYYNDQIAQPRIYNRALTASEVLNNYNATKAQYQ
jgi:hypothetical protein